MIGSCFAMANGKWQIVKRAEQLTRWRACWGKHTGCQDVTVDRMALYLRR